MRFADPSRGSWPSRPAGVGGSGRRSFLFALAGLAAPRAGSAAGKPVTLQGSSTFTAELLHEHRAEVEALSGQELRVVPNKTAAGLMALLGGDADLAMISTALENELPRLRRRFDAAVLDRLRPFPIGETTARLIVHPDNPVRAISFDDLARVLRGEVTNWRDLGGADRPIRVVTARTGGGVAETGGGVATTVAARVLGPGASIAAPAPIWAQQTTQVATVVEQEPAALGLAQSKRTRGRAVADLATPAPIEQALSLVSLGEPAPEAAAVIEACRHVAARVLGD